MIRDTLLICSIVLCCVLFYRIYVMSQQVNNLEEKINVLDTFSQSIYNYVSTKEEKEREKDDVVTYSNQDIKEQEKLIKERISQSINGLLNVNNNVSENTNTMPLSTNQEESETENESNEYNVNQPVNQFEDKLTENFESKEILSEMVSQLKETLIENDTAEKESNNITEPEVNDELHTENQPNELYNLLNNTFNTENNTLKEFEQPTNKVNTKIVDNKKKEEELMKMKLQDLKNLAKKKNIKVVDTSNKPKKKETLVMELLKH